MSYCRATQTLPSESAQRPCGTAPYDEIRQLAQRLAPHRANALAFDAMHRFNHGDPLPDVLEQMRDEA